MEKIAIASDHAGRELKDDLRDFLVASGVEVVDMGVDSDASVDYPDYGSPVAESVSKGEIERGILVCGTGVGMSILANKFRGVRAALVSDVLTARIKGAQQRQHTRHRRQDSRQGAGPRDGQGVDGGQVRGRQAPEEARQDNRDRVQVRSFFKTLRVGIMEIKTLVLYSYIY